MKAIEINGEIKTYPNLPSSWGNIIGGFNNLSNEEAQTFGFYDVTTPAFDDRIQELGDIYFDQENNVFTYPVNDLTISDSLTELKEARISQLKTFYNNKLKETDWYYIREIQRQIEVPQDIEDQRNLLITECQEKETEINNLTTKINVITYEFI